MQSIGRRCIEDQGEICVELKYTVLMRTKQVEDAIIHLTPQWCVQAILVWPSACVLGPVMMIVGEIPVWDRFTPHG